ncbi:MAG: FAD binding domain-containing protein, partial [Lacisediminimonas sp.]|nr:FAD binding domain-containing protein [Lacisediminimonas sp.]
MKPAPFALHRPRDMQSVLALLDAHGMDARLLAGGQSLVPMMNLRLVGFEHLIDLNRVAGLDGVRLDGDWLHIGAMT